MKIPVYQRTVESLPLVNAPKEIVSDGIGERVIALSKAAAAWGNTLAQVEVKKRDADTAIAVSKAVSGSTTELSQLQSSLAEDQD